MPLEQTRPSPSSVSLLVLQPTPFCNVDCDYCYLPNRDDRSRMSSATLRAVLGSVLRSPYVGEDLTIVWHAGEPLVLPIEFYTEAVAIAEELRPPQCRIRHSMQTNGTLVSKAWCDFFLEFDIRVGVSIDGPRHVHDFHRKTRSGRGTFDKTVAGIDLLRNAGKDFHVISVLTDENIFIPDEMFHFYDSLGITNVCFNIEESDGIHSSAFLRRRDARNAYFAFLEAFMFLVRRSSKTWAVREFDLMQRAIFRPQEIPFRNAQVEPFAIVSVDVSGNFTTFSPEFVGMKNARFGDFVVGNLATGELDDALSQPKFIELWDEIASGVSECEGSCEYFSVCGGGAPANKLGESDRMDGAATTFCECTVMSTADLVLSLLDAEISSPQFDDRLS